MKKIEKAVNCRYTYSESPEADNEDEDHEEDCEDCDKDGQRSERKVSEVFSGVALVLSIVIIHLEWVNESSCTHQW